MNREKPVSFSNRSGQTLKGILHCPATNAPRGAVVLCHGMESNKESEKLVSLSRRLAARGFLALRFDFACAGESSGKFEDITYSGEVEDLRAAFDLMAAYRAGRTGILGSSMGGTVAVLFAAGEPNVSALVTIAAPCHPEKITQKILSPEELESWRRLGFFNYHGRRINVSLLEDLQQIRVPEAARRISCPALIVHGEADETVPVEEAYELYGEFRGPKEILILKGADHRLSDVSLRETALAQSVDWLCRHLQRESR